MLRGIKLMLPFSGKLLWEKTFAKWWKKNFAEKTFADYLLMPPKDATPPNFMEKNFANSHKTMKFVKVFSSKVSCYTVLSTTKQNQAITNISPIAIPTGK